MALPVCATCGRELPVPAWGLPMDENKRGDVLLKLLEQNRTEIRFWHERLFTTSFWVNAAILGIVGFALKETDLAPALRWLAAFGVVALFLFHGVVAWSARTNIGRNGDDLVTIQNALLLTMAGAYLANGVIYPAGPFPWRWRGWYLIGLNAALTLGAVGVLLYPWVSVAGCTFTSG